MEGWKIEYCFFPFLPLYPSLVCTIRKPYHADKTGVQWQEGEKTVIMLDGTGIGETYLDDWLDVYIKAEQKKAFSVLTDGTNEYTDSNGNIYINN